MRQNCIEDNEGVAVCHGDRVHSPQKRNNTMNDDYYRRGCRGEEISRAKKNSYSAPIKQILYFSTEITKVAGSFAKSSAGESKKKETKRAYGKKFLAKRSKASLMVADNS